MIRTRFAPSPTGEMHVGNARTALFNALLAKSVDGGQFVLRIENTDVERSKVQFEQQLQQDLTALGIDWDEGDSKGGPYAPYNQKARRALYESFLNTLLERGLAYPCFCTQDDLKAMRLEQKLAGIPPRYDGRWADADPAVVAQKKADNVPYSIRFKVPKNQTISFTDLVKGIQRYKTNEIGDFVIVKESGQATFFFANAIDDALMNISHVIRGDDHLTNTPRQLMLLEALNLTKPQYGHISTILGSDGKPLSKRNGSMSIRQMIEQGWLPEAVINYFARLGHYYEDNNVLSMSQLAHQFDPKKLSKSAAKYDENQLIHWQKEVLNGLSDESVLAWIEEKISEDVAPETYNCFVQAIRHNILKPEDAQHYAQIIYNKIDAFKDESLQCIIEAGDDYFQIACTAWEQMKTVEGMLTALKQASYKGKALFMPLRIALTGQHKGPELAKIVSLMDEALVFDRLQTAHQLCISKESAQS